MIIKNLRYSRESLDIKQKDLATFFGVHHSTYSGWETGKDTIPINRLIQYANTYKFNIDYLYGFSKDKSFIGTYSDDAKIIGENLRSLRKKYGYTQQQIANKLNCGRSTYALYESGKNIILTEFLYALSKIYPNFSVDYILKKQK